MVAKKISPGVTSNNMVKTSVKLIAAYLGVDIRRMAQWERDKYCWLSDFAIKSVLDIGANTGQFAAQIHKVFPEAMIYSFEPLFDCFTALMKNTQHIRKIKPYMLALGDFNGETYINKNDFTPSSSILDMSDSHKELFPHTRNTTKEKAKMMRLDDVVVEFDIAINRDVLIKLDVQGYEDRVVLGGRKTFSEARAIIAETSFVELYQHQVLFDGLYLLLKDLGFVYVGNLKQLVHPSSGKPIQADAVFVKLHTQ
jgi:FkbM family methyltransferase